MLRTWIMHVYMELRAGDALLGNLLAGELIAWNIQLCQVHSQLFKAHAGIDQRPNRHVTADPGKAVKVCGSHGYPCTSDSPKTLMLWAI